MASKIYCREYKFGFDFRTWERPAEEIHDTEYDCPVTNPFTVLTDEEQDFILVERLKNIK